MHTNAYKGGGGGLNMTKSTHFVRRFIENGTTVNNQLSYLSNDISHIRIFG